MERKYPNLCKPITLGRVTFRNRMPPLIECISQGE